MNHAKYILLFIPLLVISCKNNCFKGPGETITQQRYVETFASLTVQNNIDLIIRNSPELKVEVEAGKKIIDNIFTDVSNGHLTIRNENKCNWARSYENRIKVYVSCSDLFEIYNNSYGDISTEGTFERNNIILHNYGNGVTRMTIKCDKLNVDTNFLGEILFSGESDDVNAHCFRLARLDTRQLKCQNFSILSDAEGDMYIYAENNLNGTIRSSGNIRYYGNPLNTQFEKSGTGNFIKAD